MAIAQKGLQIVLTAVDKASATLNNTNKSFGKLSNSAKIAGAAIGTAAIALGVTVVKAAAKFETAMSDVNTLFDDNGESVAELEKGIKDLLKTVPKTAEDLGASAYQIVSAGISDTSEALVVLEASAKLAVAGLSTTEEATNILTSALNTFKDSGLNASQTADVLFKTVKAGKTTVSELAQAFGATAPIIESVGVTLQDFSAATAALTTTGLPAAQAQNALRGAISALIKPTSEMEKLFKLVGVESGPELIETSANMGEAFKKLRDAGDANNITMADAFGRIEGLNAVIGLLDSSSESYNETLEAMINGQEQLGIAFEKQSATAQTQYMILKNNLNVVMIDLGNKILPKLVTWLRILNDEVLPGLNIMWDEMTFKIKSTIIELERIITTMKAYANAAKTIATIGVLGDNGLMSKITGRANGGVVGLGETTLVGENGPEIARFPAGTRITPNSQVGNSPMTINITGTFLSEDSAEQVGDLIIDKLKLQGAI